MTMIPVIQFGGLQPPETPGPASVLSRKIGEGLSDAMGHAPVRADIALEALAVWVAAIICVHPSSQDYLAEHFADALAARM